MMIHVVKSEWFAQPDAVCALDTTKAHVSHTKYNTLTHHVPTHHVPPPANTTCHTHLSILASCWPMTHHAPTHHHHLSHAPVDLGELLADVLLGAFVHLEEAEPDARQCLLRVVLAHVVALVEQRHVVRLVLAATTHHACDVTSEQWLAAE